MEISATIVHIKKENSVLKEIFTENTKSIGNRFIYTLINEMNHLPNYVS